MEATARPLTKRARAPIACDSCRQNKSKCDGNKPVCQRCARLSSTCVYSQKSHDKRLDRREEQRANLELRSRVRELESQLAAAKGDGSASGSNPGSQRGGNQPISSAADFHPPEVPEAREENANNGMRTGSSSRAASTHESPVDVLAAGVFDHPSAGYLCYFGSSSNHAIFWSLTASIANMGHRSSHLHQEPLRPGQPQRGPAQLPIPPPSSVAERHRRGSEQTLVPEHGVATRWIARFFETIGTTLPYVTEPAILRILERVLGKGKQEEPSSRTSSALLHIVFAHALSTLDETSPEPFYRQTLRLLDPKTLYVSGVELLQTLMLLSIYQQNSQRSTESLTTHALAVKTSYHLGVHATFLYDFVHVREKEIRARLWYAVVNQDRMLSTALGQPCLIPPQHVRDDVAEFLDTTRQNRTVEMSCSKENLDYFRSITSLHQLMGVALDFIYDANISTSTRLKYSDLISKTVELSLRLEDWRGSHLAAGPIGCHTDFSTWPSSLFDNERNSILKSIFYYRTAILIHAPLLMMSLELATSDPAAVASRIVQSSVLPLLQTDFDAVTGLHHLIRGILQFNRPFMRCNPIWWTCNYAALTMSLHSFSFWVASKNPDAAFIALGMDSAELEGRLRACLETLKGIGVSSAMSVKAHRCLHRHLTFLSSAQSPSAAAGYPSIQYDQNASRSAVQRALPTNPNMEFPGDSAFMGHPAPEMFGDFDFQALFGVDSLGLELGVSDFDATGLI